MKVNLIFLQLDQNLQNLDQSLLNQQLQLQLFRNIKINKYLIIDPKQLYLVKQQINKDYIFFIEKRKMKIKLRKKMH